MPRNPDKARCQIPRCRSWAMRGHSHCRSHRDRELGPRGGGAPHRNLNAFKTGDHAHPLSTAGLHEFAGHLVRQPEELPEILNLVIMSVNSRVRDPYRALVALQVAISDLTEEVAVSLFATETSAWLLRLPPSQTRPALLALRRRVQGLSAGAALVSLRHLIIESENKEKQVPVHSRTSLLGAARAATGALGDSAAVRAESGQSAT